MTIFKNSGDLIEYIEKYNLQIHFVPTMGALHDGHISLIKKSREAEKTTLCSIFVNPTQFNNASDLQHYPRTIEADIELLIKNECDILYLPGVEDIYPFGMDYKTGIDISVHDSLLEGSHRPGHFDGVVQVIDRFVQIIDPQAIYLGEKDLQQIQVISQLISQKYPDIRIIPCPTLREKDGLARSSRNKRLSAEQRTKAALIYKNIKFIVDNKGKQPYKDLRRLAFQNLENEGYEIDYIELIDTENWTILTDFSTHKGEMAVLIAASLGGIRLIDNILF